MNVPFEIFFTSEIVVDNGATFLIKTNSLLSCLILFLFPKNSY